MKNPLAYCLGLALYLGTPCWAASEPETAPLPPAGPPAATGTDDVAPTADQDTGEANAQVETAPAQPPPARTPPTESAAAPGSETKPAPEAAPPQPLPATAAPPPAQGTALINPRLDRLEARVASMGTDVSRLADHADRPAPSTVPPSPPRYDLYLATSALVLGLFALATALFALWAGRDGKRLRTRLSQLESLVQRLETQQRHLRGELDGGPDSSSTARAQVQLVRDAWQQTEQALSVANAPAGEAQRLKGAFERLLDLNPQTAQIGAQQIQSRARRIPTEALRNLAAYGWPDNAVKGLLRAAYEDHKSAQAEASAHPPVPETGRVIQVEDQTISVLRTAPGQRPAAETDTLILAHGIGESLRSPLLTALAQALGQRGITTLRFNFPFAEAGKRGPDRDALMDQVYKGVIETLQGDAEWRPGRLFLGGRRLGARCASRLAADTPGIAGLVALSFDLHPQGKPNQLRRGQHLAGLPIPALYLCGELDRQCNPAALRQTIGQNARIEIIEGINPAFKPARIGATTEQQIIDRVAVVVQEWMSAQN